MGWLGLRRTRLAPLGVTGLRLVMGLALGLGVGACAPSAAQSASAGGWLGTMPPTAARPHAADGFAQRRDDDASDNPRATRTPNRRGAWLGVELGKGDAPGTVAVKRVVRGSPADRSGLVPGDVLASIDGAVVSEPRDVQRAVGEHAPGERGALSVRRGATELALEAALEHTPAPGETARRELMNAPAPELGALVAVGSAFPKALAALRGRVVLLDFWASWCVPCRLLSGSLARYHERLGPRGLSILGVADDEHADAAQAAAAWGIPYPVAADESKRTQQAFDVDILPTLVVIDRTGKVREIVTGYSAREAGEVQALLERLLDEPG